MNRRIAMYSDEAPRDLVPTVVSGIRELLLRIAALLVAGLGVAALLLLVVGEAALLVARLWHAAVCSISAAIAQTPAQSWPGPP